MRILLFDNYDSFTYNLYNQLKMVRPDYEITVLRSRDKAVLVAEFDILVISPGPMTPEDVGVLPELFTNKIIPERIPVLGICLGLQFLAHYFGVQVGRSKQPLHGTAVAVEHQNQDLFQNIPSPFQVARYNSLEVQIDALSGSVLEILAIESTTSAVMGLKHKNLPFAGVQFHPESFLTEHGNSLIDNFFRIYVENRI